ncbi:MAG TPA: phage protein Gp37 [Aliidongia sp.]|nr:phage protein Gp37 [Aliidongia sp.]
MVALAPSVIAAVEDEIASALKTVLGPYVRACESVPAGITPEEWGDRLRATPALYVSFGGGEARPTRNPTLDGRFSVYAATGADGREEQRRRGSKVAIGAYQLVEYVVSIIHSKQIGAYGVPQLQDVSNLWSEVFDSLGLTVYAATFKIPFDFPGVVDPDTLGSFQTFDGQIPFAPPAPDASIPLDPSLVAIDGDVTLTGA